VLGCKGALRERVLEESCEPWTPTRLAATAFMRAGRESGRRAPRFDLLDELPMETVGAVGPYLTALTQLGCRTLRGSGRPPVGGNSRRTNKQVLAELDQADRLRPEAHVWVELPATFEGRLKIMSQLGCCTSSDGRGAPAHDSDVRVARGAPCWVSVVRAALASRLYACARNSYRGEVVISTAVPIGI